MWFVQFYIIISNQVSLPVGGLEVLLWHKLAILPPLVITSLIIYNFKITVSILNISHHRHIVVPRIEFTTFCFLYHDLVSTYHDLISHNVSHCDYCDSCMSFDHIIEAHKRTLETLITSQALYRLK